jgi:hypothetical protein
MHRDHDNLPSGINTVNILRVLDGDKISLMDFIRGHREQLATAGSCWSRVLKGAALGRLRRDSLSLNLWLREKEFL